MWLSTNVAFNQCGFQPMWLSHRCGFQPVWLLTSVAFNQCGFQPVWLSTSVAFNQCGFQPMWLSTSVASYQCGFQSMFLQHRRMTVFPFLPCTFEPCLHAYMRTHAHTHTREHTHTHTHLEHSHWIGCRMCGNVLQTKSCSITAHIQQCLYVPHACLNSCLLLCRLPLCLGPCTHNQVGGVYG